MRQIDIVVKAVLHGRAGGELGLGPDAQDAGRQHVRGGMAQALEIGHLLALLGGFAVGFRHKGNSKFGIRNSKSDLFERREFFQVNAPEPCLELAGGWRVVSTCTKKRSPATTQRTPVWSALA